MLSPLYTFDWLRLLNKNLTPFNLWCLIAFWSLAVLILSFVFFVKAVKKQLMNLLQMLSSFGNVHPVHECISWKASKYIFVQHLCFRNLKKEYKYSEKSYKSFGGNDSLPLDNSSINSDSGRPVVFTFEHWIPSFCAT